MTNYDPTLSYHQASARGASPVAGVVALYDTILRDFVRALAALQAGDVETRVLELNHALLVIAQLQGVLDHERGGDAAKNLDRFYHLTRGLIVQANFKAAPQPIEELIELFGGVRQAWSQAEQESHAGQIQAPAPDQPGDPAAADAASPASDDVDTPQLQWSA
ncbi:MAG TPA: flagellar export chaperone FliS [Verrucomicrobiae bacterium]|nr:flagellar export chaperone FliS [Verrucomicrobiae bacterium]